MLPDPISLTSVYGRTTAQRDSDFTTGLSFARTGSTLNSSTYRYAISATHYIDMFVGNQVGKRKRFTVRFTETELVTDPVDSTLNSVKTSTAYVVVDRSLLGAGTTDVGMLNMLAYLLADPSDAASIMQLVLAGQT